MSNKHLIRAMDSYLRLKHLKMALDTEDPYEGVSYRSSGHHLANAGEKASMAGHSRKQVHTAAANAGLNHEQTSIMVGAHKAHRQEMKGGARDIEPSDEERIANQRQHIGFATGSKYPGQYGGGRTEKSVPRLPTPPKKINKVTASLLTGRR
jgi:hypothetical protein